MCMGRGTYTTQSCVWGGVHTQHNYVCMGRGTWGGVHIHGEGYIHMGRGAYTCVWGGVYIHMCMGRGTYITNVGT